jgi:hypothetical protein
MMEAVPSIALASAERPVFDIAAVRLADGTDGVGLKRAFRPIHSGPDVIHFMAPIQRRPFAEQLLCHVMNRTRFAVHVRHVHEQASRFWERQVGACCYGLLGEPQC